MPSYERILVAGISSFVITAIGSAFAYLAATVAARFFTDNPRGIYIRRLVYMPIFILIGAVWMPAAGFSGTPYRRVIWEAHLTGVECGIHTIWIWYVYALLKFPRHSQEP